jgi:hypothetical protein
MSVNLDLLQGRAQREIVLAACGLATSVAAAVAMAWVEVEWHVAVYTYAVWWLVPIGAMGAGVVASTGYLWGARWLGVRPGWLSRASLLLVSVAAFFAIHYVEFLWGHPTVGFWSYLDNAVQSASYETKVGETVVRAWSAERLGALGYVVVALQVVGFAMGGLVVFGWLRATPYCSSCSAYLRRKSRFDRTTDGGRVFADVSRRVEESLERGDIRSAAREHAALRDLRLRERLGTEYTSRMEVWGCAGCDLRWVRVSRQGSVFTKWIREAAP